MKFYEQRYFWQRSAQIFSLCDQVFRWSWSPSWKPWCLCCRLACCFSLPSSCLPSLAWTSTWASSTVPASATKLVCSSFCKLIVKLTHAFMLPLFPMFERLLRKHHFQWGSKLLQTNTSSRSPHLMFVLLKWFYLEFLLNPRGANQKRNLKGVFLSKWRDSLSLSLV